MRWYMLAVTAFMHAVVNAESIIATGNITAEHVQMLYNQLGGTFVLPFEGANGQNVTVTGIQMLTSNVTESTIQKRSWTDLDMISSSKRQYYSIDKRAPAYTVDSTTCTSPPQYGDRLFTTQQQLFINGKLCTFAVSATPTVFSLIGLTVANLKCGVDFAYICSGVVTIGSAIAGQYIGPGMQENCNAAYNNLVSSCGEKGGQEEVSISGGSTFLLESYATTESGTDCSGSGEDCTTYTCNGDCNPGGDTP